jgi:hypothetical protein
MDETSNPFCEIYDNVLDIFGESNSSLASQIPSPEPFIPLQQPDAPPFPPIEQNYDQSMPLPPEAEYDSQQKLEDAIHNWARHHNFAFIKARSTICNTLGRRNYVWACDRYGPLPKANQKRQRNTATRKTGCKFSINAISVGGSWQVRHRPNPETHIHNHPPSRSITSHPSHRRLPKELLEQIKDLHNSGTYPFITFQHFSELFTYFHNRD